MRWWQITVPATVIVFRSSGDWGAHGEDVRRFGARELEGDAGVDTLGDFFRRLFARHVESPE